MCNGGGIRRCQAQSPDESAISRLSEPDVAREVTVLAKANMQLQSSVAMRTQANVLSDAALKVLMG